MLAAKRVGEPGPASVLGILATWLLEVGAKDADLRVVAEALDKTFDAFSEDDTDGVFASQQLLPKLRQEGCSSVFHDSSELQIEGTVSKDYNHCCRSDSNFLGSI